MKYSLTLCLLALPGVAHAGQNISATGIKRVIIKTTTGDVRVEQGDDTNIAIDCGDDKFKYETSNGTLKIRMQHGTIRASLPAGVSLEVDSRTGDTRIRGTFAEILVKLTSGDADIEAKAKELQAGLVSGSLEFRGSASRAEAKSVSGHVKLDGVFKAVKLKSTSGDVTLATSVANRVELKTIGGDIRADAKSAAGATIEAQSHSGDVVIRLGPGSGYALDAKSMSGKISADGEDLGNRAETKVGDGSASITAKTFSGDIKIKTLN